MNPSPPAAAAAALYQTALDTFSDLLAQAQAAGDPEPTAMTLATLGEGRPHARIVLLKGVDARGFRFYTNYASAKAGELDASAWAALCFHWKTLRQGVQVRVEGRVEKLAAAESDAYFATRPRGSQLGAWASLQSQPLPDPAQFEARYAQFEQRFAAGEVARPPHWGGYLVVPDRIEFWYGAQFRLHERQVYARDAAGIWSCGMLYP
ncbi:MAG: pyridoxamine 5'-phosphate oxidase [Dokdonella sp.]|uniref:pyridoxamine 5'-phosphate oxidase n=1 Tax=Dokdonella sp. TaxID=2291710 RepID=UPI0025BABA99|nr:pyridoxamine 5'-phosphate oxidase [Dokdonella sp.]MBX3700902.1 pyridoxamine 5'-phosphate oxidase [Dokdonella sp.]MCW5579213.1 pyridoxamine 5'-phosphate oxidase [Dokdonella sp.]